MTGPPEPVGVSPENVQDRYSRRVAVAIVTATLVGGMVGFLQARSGRAADLANIRAQSLLVRAFGGLARGEQTAQVAFQTLGRGTLQRGLGITTFQTRLLAPSGLDTRSLVAAEQRYLALAEDLEELSTIARGGPTSLRGDPLFPQRLFLEQQHEADRLWALADGANEEDGRWEAQEAMLSAILAILAVAVYLLGLSLTIRTGARRLLSGLGVGLLVVGAVWAVVLAVGQPDRAPAAAAEAYADGRQSLLQVRSPADAAEAARHYSRAIALRPGFARAHVERAEARFLAGSPQASLSFTTINVSRPENIRMSISDLRRAQDLGVEGKSVLGPLGFQTALLGIREGDDGLVEEGLALTERAVAIDPADPQLLYNRAVALMVLGRDREAADAFREAAAHTVFVDVKERVRRDQPQLEQVWVGGALADLEMVLAARPDLARPVSEAKQMIVAAVFGSGPPGPAPADTDVHVDAFPAELQWRAELDGLRPRDRVVAQWYARPDEGSGWVVLNNVSGLAEPGFDPTLGQHFDLTPYLSTSLPPSCLPDGHYRVELYMGGRLVGQAEVRSGFEGQTALAPELNMGLCLPAGWESSSGSITGLVQGFVDPSGKAGAYLFRFQRLEAAGASASRRLLDVSVASFRDLLPADLSAREPGGDGFFLGLDGVVERFYSYRGGVLRAGAGAAPDGGIMVAWVFGPRSAQLDRVYESIVELRPI